MTNHDDPVVPDNIARLSNAISHTLAQAGASHGDGLLALIHILLTAVVETAKDEDEAVEHAGRIAEHLRANVRGYFKRHQAGELITRLQ
jgi:hypothetical protein